jgi:hypothetical protein
MLDKFRSDLAIRDVHVQVLMVHGEEDNVIPLASKSSSRKPVAAAKVATKPIEPQSTVASDIGEDYHKP